MNSPNLEPEDDEPTLPKLTRSQPAAALQTPLPVAADTARPSPSRRPFAPLLVWALAGFAGGWLCVSGAAATLGLIAPGAEPNVQPTRMSRREPAVASRPLPAPCPSTALTSSPPPAIPIVQPAPRPKSSKPPAKEARRDERPAPASTKSFPAVHDAGSDPVPVEAFEPVNLGF